MLNTTGAEWLQQVCLAFDKNVWFISLVSIILIPQNI